MDDQPWVTTQQLRHLAHGHYLDFVAQGQSSADPSDWPEFRQAMVDALNAAWSLDGRLVDDRDPQVEDERVAARLRQARAILDEVRARVDPAVDWPGFRDALWDAARGPLLGGL